MNKNIDGLDPQTSRLFALLLRCKTITEVRLDKALREAKLTMAKFGPLQILVQANEPVQLGQMAEYLHCVRSNATQMVDRLEKEGLVERVFDAADRRIVLARITEEGRRRHAAGIQAIQSVEQEILRHFGLEEREQLISLLSRLETLWS